MSELVFVVGDLHGHVQLALAMIAQWNREDTDGAIFLLGDAGLFSRPEQVDEAARARAVHNPCELEFLTQWADPAGAPWLPWIFASRKDGGLGVTCPVVLVHGEQDPPELYAEHLRAPLPHAPAPVASLPRIGPGGWLRYLPSGWRCALPSGRIVAGLGGVEARGAGECPPEARLDPERVAAVRAGAPVDLLLTHQGPAAAQGKRSGSRLLDSLLDPPVAPVWCYSHAPLRHTNPPELRVNFPEGRPVLLKQIQSPAFSVKNGAPGAPGVDAWASVHLGEQRWVRPASGTLDFHARHWKKLKDGRLVAPSLAARVPEGW
ncbi:MAG: hypothetical protein KIS92_18555 [Planctomycetota bacterium]|nr:hypothetical protein [Planctomycetota bacterium]